jgi:hypothetical protein
LAFVGSVGLALDVATAQVCARTERVMSSLLASWTTKSSPAFTTYVTLEDLAAMLVAVL